MTLNWALLQRSALDYIDDYAPTSGVALPIPPPSPGSAKEVAAVAKNNIMGSSSKCSDSSCTEESLSKSFEPLFSDLRDQIQSQQVSFELLAKMVKEEGTRRDHELQVCSSRLEVLEAYLGEVRGAKIEAKRYAEEAVQSMTSEFTFKMEDAASSIHAAREAQSSLNRRMTRLEGALQGYATSADVNSSLRALVDPLRASVDNKFAKVSADIVGISSALSAAAAADGLSSSALASGATVSSQQQNLSRIMNRMTILEDALAGEESAMRNALSALSTDIDSRLASAVQRSLDSASEVCRSLERRLEKERGQPSFMSLVDGSSTDDAPGLDHHLSGLNATIKLAEQRSTNAESAALRAESSLDLFNKTLGQLRCRVGALEDEMGGQDRSFRVRLRTEMAALEQDLDARMRRMERNLEQEMYASSSKPIRADETQQQSKALSDLETEVESIKLCMAEVHGLVHAGGPTKLAASAPPAYKHSSHHQQWPSTPLTVPSSPAPHQSSSSGIMDSPAYHSAASKFQRSLADDDECDSFSSASINPAQRMSFANESAESGGGKRAGRDGEATASEEEGNYDEDLENTRPARHHHREQSSSSVSLVPKSQQQSDSTAQCTHCLRRMSLDTLDEHSESCELRMIPCPNDCGAKVLVRNLSRHRASCSSSSSRHNGLESQEDGGRGKESDGVESGCISISNSSNNSSCASCCRHCGMEVTGSRPAHESACNKRPITCLRCKESFPFDAMPAHAKACVRK